jgi:magnesium chelatase subunit H
MGFYTYLAKVLNIDGVIHFGTHGSLEFMPGKQIGLSGECWPDRLIDELPNFYIYSVNNPSEGSIAKRRSYAELISYLTPPIENAGLYKELAGLKELVMAYRESRSETERAQLFQSIEHLSGELHL